MLIGIWPIILHEYTLICLSAWKFDSERRLNFIVLNSEFDYKEKNIWILQADYFHLYDWSKIIEKVSNLSKPSARVNDRLNRYSSHYVDHFSNEKEPKNAPAAMPHCRHKHLAELSRIEKPAYNVPKHGVLLNEAPPNDICVEPSVSYIIIPAATQVLW